MDPHRILRLLLLALLAGPGALAAAHDLYLAAAFNNGSRVMGSNDGSANGVFVRTADGFRHVGINYPLAISATFDPRDANVFYVACLSGVLRTLDGGQTWRLVTGWAETEQAGRQAATEAADQSGGYHKRRKDSALHRRRRRGAVGG